LTRTVVTNPALNTNPAFRNPAVVPFGIEFVDDALRKELDKVHGGLADEVETMYYRQCQEDAELNGTRLPRSHDSKLWGFIYGERLVSAQRQLDSLAEDEQFMANQLRATIDELSMKMKRYYPSLDFAAQTAGGRDSIEDDPDYAECYNEALAAVIAADPKRFVAIFKNNAFIPAEALADSAADDRFGDHLPSDIEQALCSHFELQWDLKSPLAVGLDPYFERMSKMEQVVSPKMDSLSKNLRKHFAGFLLHCFEANKLQHVRDIIASIESVTGSVMTDDVGSMANDEVAERTLSLLHEMGSAPALISTLFFGKNDSAEAALSGKSKAETLAILKGADPDRLRMVNQSLQMYQYLKYNSMARLFVAVLVAECPGICSQFLNGFDGDQNIERFATLNNEALDAMVSAQSMLYESLEDLTQSVDALTAKIAGHLGVGSVALDLSVFPAAPSIFSKLMASALSAAKERGDILGEIRYSTFSRFVDRFQSKMAGLELASFLMNPSSGGMDGNALKNMAFAFATNESAATELLTDGLAARLQRDAELDADSVPAFKSSLISAVSSEVERLRRACGEYNASRNELEGAMERVTVRFEGINFDHAQSNYDPLSMYLANFRYFTKYQ